MSISSASSADLPLDQISALAAVVDAGSFDGAARALGVTPSAVSQRIKALESRVGAVLLRRSQPVVATESGEPVVRLARQVDLAQRDARAALGVAPGAPHPVPLAVSADALATWVLPVLADVAARTSVVFALHREDQDHSIDLLRRGTVMAAVTSQGTPVQGCTVRPLTAMRYRPRASPAFAARWFPAGPTAAAYGVAPVVDFDGKDDLQRAHLRRVAPDAAPPRHAVPAAAEFVTAVALGMGWGMVPDLQAAGRTDLVTLGDAAIDVPLFWQQWALDSPVLRLVADGLADAAPPAS